MVEAELLIGHLRRQVRDLQSLLNYLESRQLVEHDDYAYSHAKIRGLIRGLKDLQQFASERGATHALRALWLS